MHEIALLPGTTLILCYPYPYLFKAKENMHNFDVKNILYFKVEIIFNFFHIYCELISILFSVKTKKKRGGMCTSLLYNALHTPTPILRVKRKKLVLFS